MSLIVDREQFFKFIDIMPELQNDENYFLSLSARNKYLTTEERIKFDLGRTEMFGRMCVRKKEDFEFKIAELEGKLFARRTRNGSVIPEKCLVCYVNINPSSMIKAYRLFTSEIDRQLFDATLALQKGLEANYDGLKILDRALMNCIQKARSAKHFVDIDMDIKSDEVLNIIAYALKNQPNIEFHVIETHGGYHIMIKTETLPHKFNLGLLVQKADQQARIINPKSEVVFNRNQMVPMPGTLHAGFLVRFVDV